MATLLLFGPARSTAGTARASIDAASLGELVAVARDRFGPDFARLLEVSVLWVNGEAAGPATPLGPGDEVAVVPPVSGGT